MSKRVLRTMTDGQLKTAIEMDANGDVVRNLIKRGLIEKMPQTYKITERGIAYASVVPKSEEEKRIKDNARKAARRRQLGMREYSPRTAQTRYPKKHKETKEEMCNRIANDALALARTMNSVFAMGNAA